MFLLALVLAAVLSGATAAVAGFGIGSLLTPLLATQVGTPTAVAAIAIPHVAATAPRFWRLRHAVDGTVIRRFGLLSAVGGLAGSQGGLRAAALLSFSLTPVAYVATATATALLVDVARTPIYVWRAGGALVPLWPERGVTTAGVLLGTLAGERLLPGLSPARFRTIIAIVIGLLGAWIVYSVA